MEDVKTNCLEWAFAGMALPGNEESGDRYVCRSFSRGALVAVIDGIGHGPAAAAAAAEACAALEENAGENVIALVRMCHEKLRGTRGAAISLASFNFADGLVTWLGVGNVHGFLLPADSPLSAREESMLQRPGVVGSHLPWLQAAVLPLSAGDTMVFLTDGIANNFDRALVRSRPPQNAADQILLRYGRENDDALILIARYRGSGI